MALVLAGFAVSSPGNLLTGWPGRSPRPSPSRPAVRGLGIAALDVAATAATALALRPSARERH